jgi:urease accessory protein
MRLVEPVLVEPAPARAWRAELVLAYEKRGERTVLAERRHDGPLVVQKPLYPEGDAVCHTLIVHPPAGVAGGDALEIGARADAHAHALLTTPGAGKWYRSAGSWATQRVLLEARAGACIEWLPQETIVFDGALASLRTEVTLAPDARYLGWEILCLGRSGSGERYTHGACRVATDIRCGERPLWRERGSIAGATRLLESPAGLGGASVCGTLLASAPEIGDELLRACRDIEPREGRGAVTRLPRVFVARYLGDSSEAARAYFVLLWRLLRPALLGRDAVEPRIWST